MLSAAHLAIFSAAALATVSALFGVFIARAVWADDLKHAQRLRDIWERTYSSMSRTIELQNNTINILHQRLGESPP